MDLFFFIILLIGLAVGIKTGAVGQLISFVAFLLGFFVACWFYNPLAGVLGTVLSMPTLCKIVAFLLLWVIIPILARLAGEVLTSALDGLSGVGVVNRAVGGILGLLKYALVLGSFIWLFTFTGVMSEEAVDKTWLGAPLKAVPEFVYQCIF